MSKKIAEGFDEAKTSINVEEPSLGRIIAFLFLVSFVGLFSIVPLRKIMIISYKLTYPSGSATAHLINSFHTPQGAIQAKQQVSTLFKSFAGSFLWSLFQWFYSAGPGCGFSSFPTFGMEAYRRRFFFDFSATYVGVGMICPYIINFSLLLGSVVSWGLMWPYIESKRGLWYDAELPRSSLHGLNGYQIFISIAMIIGDGLFNFLSILVRTSYDMYLKRTKPAEAAAKPFAGVDITDQRERQALSFDDRRRTQVFLKDQIPTSIAAGAYVLLAAISVVAIPHIFRQLKPRHVVWAYAVAPVFAFCNAYGTGLTDWSLSSSYGKLAIFIFGSSIGAQDGGVVAGLAACGLMMGIVSTASDLIQDFKTGYLTLTSPRSMFVSQVMGTGLGCIISPVVFWIFYKAYDIGLDEGYPAPYAKIYRGIALLGVNGWNQLPKYCLRFCLAFFLLAVAICALKEVAKARGWWVQDYIPSALGMAVPFFLGSFFTIDMCVGSVVLYLWSKADRVRAHTFAPAVASGLICGDGIWSLPSSILSLLNISPPMCLRVFSAETNYQVEEFLWTLRNPAAT
jgi:OPT family oligopeptide transporter